uniref:C2H2-type domain-containing protein n=2 Tax=Ditylenchus dipsaci TaxID=166011 RepID=A0A915CNS9_9BILA
MCGRYAYSIKVRRWPLRLFMHLSDAAALNGYVLFDGGVTRRRFILQLADQLMREQKERRSSVEHWMNEVFQQIDQTYKSKCEKSVCGEHATALFCVPNATSKKIRQFKKFLWQLLRSQQCVQELHLRLRPMPAATSALRIVAFTALSVKNQLARITVQFRIRSIVRGNLNTTLAILPYFSAMNNPIVVQFECCFCSMVCSSRNAVEAHLGTDHFNYDPFRLAGRHAKFPTEFLLKQHCYAEHKLKEFYFRTWVSAEIEEKRVKIVNSLKQCKPLPPVLHRPPPPFQPGLIIPPVPTSFGAFHSNNVVNKVASTPSPTSSVQPGPPQRKPKMFSQNKPVSPVPTSLVHHLRSTKVNPDTATAPKTTTTPLCTASSPPQPTAPATIVSGGPAKKVDRRRVSFADTIEDIEEVTAKKTRLSPPQSSTTSIEPENVANLEVNPESALNSKITDGSSEAVVVSLDEVSETGADADNLSDISGSSSSSSIVCILEDDSDQEDCKIEIGNITAEISSK